MVPQDQLIGNVNSIYATLRQFHDLLSTVNELVNTFTQLNGAAVLQALPTALMNPDGTLGTPDPAGAPVTGHPIDTRVVSTLSIANSSYDIGVMFNLAQAYQALMGCAAVTQQNYAPSALAKASTG